MFDWLCFHKYKFLGYAREGEWEAIADTHYRVFFCLKCGKIKLKYAGKFTGEVYGNIPIVSQLIKTNSKNIIKEMEAYKKGEIYR